MEQQVKKIEYFESLFMKSMSVFLNNRSSSPRNIHVMAGVAGYKKLRQMVKNLKTIKRLRRHGTRE